MNQLSAEVIIVGGGLAGNTLAGLLGSRGLDCIVIEADDKTTNLEPVPRDPRALAITRASRCILDSFDAWQHLPADRLGCFRGMHVWDENGKGEIEFDSADLCQPTLGYIIEQSVLQSTLEQVVGFMPGVNVLYSTRIQGIQWQEDAVTVTLDNNEKLSAKLLVGADGVHSVCRELAEIRSVVHDYQQQALACLVSTDRKSVV